MCTLQRTSNCVWNLLAPTLLYLFLGGTSAGEIWRILDATEIGGVDHLVSIILSRWCLPSWGRGTGVGLPPRIKWESWAIIVTIYHTLNLARAKCSFINITIELYTKYQCTKMDIIMINSDNLPSAERVFVCGICAIKNSQLYLRDKESREYYYKNILLKGHGTARFYITN